MANVGYFDPDLRAAARFDPDLVAAGWFDGDLIDLEAAPDNPLPVLTAIDPDTTVAGTGPLIVVATGTGFVAASALRWNAEALATNPVDDTELQGVIPAGHLASPTSALLTVLTPGPGGGISAAFLFTVTAAPPAPEVPTDSFQDRAEVIGGARLV